jgi:DNA polymerase
MSAQRLAYLKALGIDVWQRRSGMAPEVPVEAAVEPAAAPRVRPVIDTRPAAAGVPPASHSAMAAAPEAAAPEAAAAPGAIAASGTTALPVSMASDAVPPPIDSAAAESPTPQRLSATAPIEHMNWEALEDAVRGCTRCPLHATRTQGVFGVGNRNAQWMIIGEAPGAEEDRQGEPFVGRAGQLLYTMLKAVGLSREQVFIANILKSRPPGNRDPRPEETRACLPYLYRQIELVDPALILCVGRIAAQTLLETDQPIGKLRGTLHRIAGNRPMIVTYHPAYLLRSPAEKRKSWADLLLAMRTLEEHPGVPS